MSRKEVWRKAKLDERGGRIGVQQETNRLPAACPLWRNPAGGWERRYGNMLTEVEFLPPNQGYVLSIWARLQYVSHEGPHAPPMDALLERTGEV